MSRLMVTVQAGDIQDHFLQKKITSPMLNFHVLYKQVKPSKKVIFIFLIRSSKLNRTYRTNLKVVSNNKRLIQVKHTSRYHHSISQTNMVDQSIYFQKHAMSYFICNSPDYSAQIYLEYKLVEINFNATLVGLGSGHQLPSENNHDLAFICKRPISQKNESKYPKKTSEDFKHNSVYAHKHILAYHSIKFQNLLTGTKSWKSDLNYDIQLGDYPHKVIQFIVKFMYTGTVTPSEIIRNSRAFWMDVLKFSVEWKITELEPLALLICFSLISINNARKILHLGLQIEDGPDLKSYIVSYVKNFLINSPQNENIMVAMT